MSLRQACIKIAEEKFLFKKCSSHSNIPLNVSNFNRNCTFSVSFSVIKEYIVAVYIFVINSFKMFEKISPLV